MSDSLFYGPHDKRRRWTPQCGLLNEPPGCQDRQENPNRHLPPSCLPPLRGEGDIQDKQVSTNIRALRERASWGGGVDAGISRLASDNLGVVFSPRVCWPLSRREPTSDARSQ